MLHRNILDASNRNRRFAKPDVLLVAGGVKGIRSARPTQSISATLVRDELHAGRLVVVGPERWQIRLEIRLYRRPEAMSPAAETFWQVACARQTGD